jgi:hypothetical protein
MVSWKTSPHGDPANHIKTFLGYSHFPKDIVTVPEAWAAKTGNLVFYRKNEKVRYAGLRDVTLDLTDGVGRALCSMGEARAAAKGYRRFY